MKTVHRVLVELGTGRCRVQSQGQSGRGVWGGKRRRSGERRVLWRQTKLGLFNEHCYCVAPQYCRAWGQGLRHVVATQLTMNCAAAWRGKASGVVCRKRVVKSLHLWEMRPSLALLPASHIATLPSVCFGNLPSEKLKGVFIGFTEHLFTNCWCIFNKNNSNDKSHLVANDLLRNQNSDGVGDVIESDF